MSSRSCFYNISRYFGSHKLLYRSQSLALWRDPTMTDCTIIMLYITVPRPLPYRYWRCTKHRLLWKSSIVMTIDQLHLIAYWKDTWQLHVNITYTRKTAFYIESNHVYIWELNIYKSYNNIYSFISLPTSSFIVIIAFRNSWSIVMLIDISFVCEIIDTCFTMANESKARAAIGF